MVGDDLFLSYLSRLNHFLTRFHPSTPMIVRPVYCVVLAIPKSINHNTPFAVLEIGSIICANERI